MRLSEKRENGIFNIHSAEEFYDSIRYALERYQKSPAKKVETLFFIVMGLNHLREWIAPDYNHKAEPTTPEEKFYNDIFYNKDFKTIKALSNGSKHLQAGPKTTYESGLPISEWPDMGSLKSISEGPPSAFYVKNEEISIILERVLNFYSARWFDDQSSQSDERY